MTERKKINKKFEKEITERMFFFGAFLKKLQNTYKKQTTDHRKCGIKQFALVSN